MRVNFSNFGLVLAGLLMSCTAIQNLKNISQYEATLASSEQTDTTVTSIQARSDSKGREASLLVAFFGLDNGLPGVANKGVCPGAGGKDGMPVIFSREIDVSTMQAGDFRVTRTSGKVGSITCVTLAPADDAGELRTALLAGEFGSPEDQPAEVEIVGNILSMDKAVNFKSTRVNATRLEAGATMVFAENIPEQRLELGKRGTDLRWGGGTGCPVGTKAIVGVTWAGGVSKPGGGEIDGKEMSQYRVTLRTSTGKPLEVAPFVVADLIDGDNNHRLCLSEEGVPEAVFFPAGYLVDPRGDLNPDTRIQIVEP
jgi:hypothetical protein